ncbi:MAG: DUF3857 domain-containing protein [Cyclobacteriaceae bacterium]|nr:DUF3857 domain-containing protein [Cyclobacteriaceae bacterium HetDA_MAG_MS6]
MNIKTSITLSLALFCQLICRANSEYNWMESRDRYELDKNEKELAVIKLKVHRQYDYRYDPNTKDLIVYFTNHQITLVNNDNALARNNRIYIPIGNTLELVEVKARSLNPDGTVTIFDNRNLKEIQDEEGGTGFKIFAIEGAQVGSEIEFLYTKKQSASYFGMEYLQGKEEVKEFTFELSCPSNLEFKFKSDYELSKMVQKDDEEKVSRYILNAKNLPAIYEEDFSAYTPTRQKVEFKLSFNSAHSKGRLFTWSDAGKRIYDQIMDFDKDEKKILQKLMKDIKPGGDEASKALKIEHYVKSKFYLDENAGNEASHLSFIQVNHFSNEKGLTRLMMGLLKNADLSPALVLTCDRTRLKFDPDFENWNYLDDYLIHLPGIDQYIAPYDFQFRLGAIPFEFTAQYGLFVEEKPIQDYTYPIADVRYITPLPAKESFDNLDIKVNLNEDLSSTSLYMTRSFKGYNAYFIKAFYPTLDQAQKDTFMENLIKYIAPDAEIKSKEVIDTRFDAEGWSEPFTIKTSFESKSFIEQAGNVILFKAGDLIGEQSELYQERQRVSQVENDYNRGYLREITIDLPKGYQVQNAEDLNMDVFVKEENERIYSFKSWFELEDLTLKITIEEFYDKIYYPKEKFEDFRKVINAAADWNKIILVLKPI